MPARFNCSLKMQRRRGRIVNVFRDVLYRERPLPKGRTAHGEAFADRARHVLLAEYPSAAKVRCGKPIASAGWPRVARR